MVTATLFLTVKTCKQRTCPTADERIKKMWHIYVMEYYSAIEKNEILPLAATWMDMEGIVLDRKKTNTV